MSNIDHNTILQKRDEAQKKCVELRQKIKEMEESVIALEERVKVYNEFLKGEMSRIEVSSEDSSESSEEKKVQRRGTTPHDATKTAKSETPSQKSQGGKTPQDREQNHRPQNPEGARNAPNGKRPRNFWHCGSAYHSIF